MALVVNDRVQQTGTANTTVSFTLTGSVTGFQDFTIIGNGNTTFYAATDVSGNWEVGVGTYSTTGPTLVRTTILSSSNSGNAVTFSGTVTVFVTYPSEQSVNLDASGNVTALGTITSGVWNGSTLPVAYGGTGVTASSGANSVMLRDANQNVAVNRLNQANTSVSAAGGTTALTAASTYSQTLNGTGNQTYTMPDATTLTTGVAFVFNNNATGTLTLQDYSAGSIGTITSGGAVELVLLANSTVGGTWDVHGFLPENVTWGTNALNLGSTVITNGTWNGGTIQPAYGGTGLTTFTATNNALFSTGASTLTAGTLPVAAGGTGQTTAAAAFNALSPLTTTGDIIYEASANTAARLPIGVSGQVLTASGGIPAWATPASGAGTITRTDFTATASQTVFSVVYDVGLIDVYQNGAKLAQADFTATNGTSFTLATGATSGDLIQAEVFSSLNIYSTITAETFNGTGAQTVFTMSAVPANSASLLVAISGVVQDPTTYTVSSNTLTFSTAPPSGTGNVAVRYLGVQSVSTVSSFSAGTTGFTPATATTGGVVLAGTLATTNGGTGLTAVGTNGQVLTSNGTTLSYQTPTQTYPGAGIANSTGSAWGTSYTTTGTGTVVALATSPTFVTPALGTPASGVVTNLTGTASININGTVGATTASTGAFTTLGATGVATFSAGTVALPSITTTGDTNTGIYFPAADTIAFTEGGTESMRIDSSGNVGIGTTTMTGKLNVNATGANSRIAIGDTAANTYSTVLMYGGSGKYNFQLGVQNNVNNAFEITPSTATGGTTFSTPAFVLDSSGNVGIGTSSPYSASGQKSLSISGSDVSRIDFYNGATAISNIDCYSGGGTGLTLRNITSLPMLFNTNNTERMRIDSSGNVGIGTSSFAFAATNRVVTEINGSGSSLLALKVNNASPAYLFNDGSNLNIQNNGTGYFAFGNNSAERMRIDSSGNVGIGTSSPLGKLNASSASFGGTVSSNANQVVAENSGNAGITIASGASSLGNIFFADSGDTADGFVQYDQSGRSMRFGTATAERMRITSAGDVQLSTASTSILNSSGRKILNQTGSILQTVQGTLVGTGSGPITSTTSTSWVSTGLTASITPSSTSSKILVMYNLGNIYTTSNGFEGYSTLYRNGSNISPVGTGVNSGFTASFGNGAGVQTPHSAVYLDSPASTSAQTYTVYWNVNTGTGYLGRNAPVCTITLLEIAQ